MGCDEEVYEVDLYPPSAPRELYAEAGDRVVEVFWQECLDNDLAGYNIFVSTSYYGRYQFLGSTNQAYFIDDRIPNGQTFYYRVNAYDYNGNESQLSDQAASATPRPEGYNVVLKDYRVFPNQAGYDFSTYSIGRYDDQYTDIFFENYNGVYYMDVWDDTEIQDMGYTKSLYEIIESPTKGWSPTKDVQLIVGHTYVVRTWDYRYAKIRINSIFSTQINFDWAYQLQQYNTQLKINPNTDRKPLNYGLWHNSRK